MKKNKSKKIYEKGMEINETCKGKCSKKT